MLWLATTVVGWPLAGGEAGGRTAENVGVALLLGAWLGGTVTSLLIRRGYRARAVRAAHARAPWPRPTARSRQFSARYALLAYACTFAGVIASAAIVYFGLGVRVPVGAGVLMVDAILLGALLPLRRRGGLSREDLGLRTAPAARSFGLVVLGLFAYLFRPDKVRPRGRQAVVVNVSTPGVTTSEHQRHLR